MILPYMELLARNRHAELQRAADEARQARLAECRRQGANRPPHRPAMLRFGRR